MKRYKLLLIILLIVGCDKSTEPEDCAGVAGGSALEDICGICDGDGSTCFVTDIDGNIYSTVKIGGQIWMAENLKTTKYKEGSEISTGYSGNDWSQLSTGAYAVYDDSINAEMYGNLYNWYHVDNNRPDLGGRELCMEGWSVPTDDEWQTLTDYLGGVSVAGGKMKSTGTIEGGDGLWDSPNEGATNMSSFSGLPTGIRLAFNGDYMHKGEYGYFWSSSEKDSSEAWHWILSSFDDHIIRYNYDKKGGFSIRCLKD